MKNTIIIIMLAALAVTYVGLEQAKAGKFQNTKLAESFDVASGGTLTLDADTGSIEVESHDSDTIEVLVKKKGRGSDDFEVTFEHDGDNLKVIGDKNSSSFFNFMSVNFIVKIPNNYNVDLRTSGGSIDLESLNGEVKAYTSGGSISLGEIKGNVDIKTSGGSIKVDEVDGNIKAHTSGGSIKVQMASQPTQDSRLTTSGGSITAYLVDDIQLDLVASTSGGSVSSEFPIKGEVKRTKIEGDINGGGPKLTLKTSGGSVRIKEL